MKRISSLLSSLLFAAGLMVFTEGCGLTTGVKLDPESGDFYETARLVMAGVEKDIFLHLPDQRSRKEFIQEFWAKRDPDPDTEENEFRIEFFRRIEYANKHFREGIPGWKTDRGRIYIYLGPPDKIEQRPFINSPDIKGLILWGYYRYKLGIEFVDRVGDGRYALSRQSGAAGGLLSVIERAKFGEVYAGQADFEKLYSDFDVSYKKETQEITIVVPVASLEFIAEEGRLRAHFEFEFFIDQKKGLNKDHFTREETFDGTEDKVSEVEEILFSFPYEIKPGEYYFDVVMRVKPDIAKVRKIFTIRF